MLKHLKIFKKKKKKNYLNKKTLQLVKTLSVAKQKENNTIN